MAGRVDPSYLSGLQLQTSKIRNFCILAHVDHGKTTLSDSLISANGIISAKLAGKLRFLDSSEEEQKRGITMHSSAISLLYDLEGRREGAEAGGEKDEYLVNLVDCPGHIDFSSDVSTATRLCDGALIVIDVLEGICTQTHAVLYKALKERMRPCLVLNKIDRLLIDMRLSTVEAFQHLRRLVENVNALAFTLLNSELMKRNDGLEAAGQAPRSPTDEEEEDDPLAVEWTFSPEKGNVVFTAALDCWGFGIAKFANLWAKELGVNKNVLRKYLFEDYSFNSVTKKISRCDPQDSNARPMFASMVLDPIWKVYELAITNNAPDKAAKMALNKLKVEIPPREINPRDPRATVQSIFRRWLPLSDAILRMVVRSMPCPAEAQRNRLFTLLPGVPEPVPDHLKSVVSMSAQVKEAEPSAVQQSLDRIEASVANCTATTSDPLVVFVSKMMPVRVAELSPRDIALLNDRLRRKAEAAADGDAAATFEPLQPENEVFMALGRVYSGVLRRSSDVYVLGNRHDPTAVPADELVGADLRGEVPPSIAGQVRRVLGGSIGMYIMLGPSVFPVEEVAAGNIVGIVGLEEAVLKTATLSDTWAAHAMKAITFQAKPMVQVAIEPVSYADLKKLDAGLQSLYQYDPVVEVGVDESGQHTLVCLGELHLEQCVKSLTERFAKCEVKVSEPLISFRETVFPCDTSYQATLPPPWSDMPGLGDCLGGSSRVVTSGDGLAITFRCVPIPAPFVDALDDDRAVRLLDGLLTDNQRRLTADEPSAESESHSEDHEITVLWNNLRASLVTALSENAGADTGLAALLGGVTNADELAFEDIRNRMVSVGNANNLLLLSSGAAVDVFESKVPKTVSRSIGKLAAIAEEEGEAPKLVGSIALRGRSSLFHRVWSRLSSAVVAGFKVATAKGPLMSEPLYGVGFVVEKVEVSKAVCGLALSEAEMALVIPDYTPPDQWASSLVTGQLISEVKEALWLGMLSCPVRLVEPIYNCDLQCDQSQLGNLYAVLSRRRGDVTKEDVIEGTSLFLLSALLPVVNSFGFAQELLKKTSGSGTAPQLSFAKWQTNALDPFWRPKTEDELEEFGEASVAEHNLPRTMIDKVRKRKGLPIEEKIVAFGEKQRNMSKKK